jgi:hypothetical protein
MYFATNSKKLYLAETTADGTADSTLAEFTPSATGQ